MASRLGKDCSRASQDRTTSKSPYSPLSCSAASHSAERGFDPAFLELCSTLHCTRPYECYLLTICGKVARATYAGLDRGSDFCHRPISCHNRLHPPRSIYSIFAGAPIILSLVSRVSFCAYNKVQLEEKSGSGLHHPAVDIAYCIGWSIKCCADGSSSRDVVSRVFSNRASRFTIKDGGDIPQPHICCF